MKKLLMPFALLGAVILIGAGCTQAQNTNSSDNGNYTVEVTPLNKDDFNAQMEGEAMEEDDSDDAMEGEAMEKDGDAMMEKDDEGTDEAEGVMEKDTASAETDTTEEESEEESEETTETEQPQEETTEQEEEQAAVTPGEYTDYDSSRVASAANNGNAVLFFHASWCPSCKALDNSISSNTVPDGLTIFKVNYDKENDLRKKYGVTYQHTLVQVDANGNLIQKWSGGNTLDSVVSKLQ